MINESVLPIYNFCLMINYSMREYFGDEEIDFTKGN